MSISFSRDHSHCPRGYNETDTLCPEDREYKMYATFLLYSRINSRETIRDADQRHIPAVFIITLFLVLKNENNLNTQKLKNGKHTLIYLIDHHAVTKMFMKELLRMHENAHNELLKG